MNILKLFSANEREIKGFRKIVEQINAFEPSIKALSNDELRARTDEFRGRLQIPEALRQAQDGAPFDKLRVTRMWVTGNARTGYERSCRSFCRKRSRSCGRRASAHSACAISTSR